MHYQQQLFERVLESISQDKLFKAENEILELESSINEALERSEDSVKSQELQDLLSTLNTHPTITLFKREIVELKNLLNELKTEAGWSLVKNSNGVTTYYRHEENTPIYSVKLVGVIDCPLINICCILNEIEFYPLWIPKLSECRVVSSASRFHKMIYGKFQLPFPIASRDFCLYGFGADLLEEDDSVAVVVRSCKDTDQHEHPPVKSGNVRLDIYYAGFLLTSISPTQTLVRAIGNCDPHIPLVPYSLINLITKQIAHFYFSMLAQHAKSLEDKNSPYHARIESQAIYKEIREIIESHMKKKATEEPTLSIEETTTTLTITENTTQITQTHHSLEITKNSSEEIYSHTEFNSNNTECKE
eukprot:TRINITY_DN664_c0_g1_i1.p1 TRINITY_DN664_c0_g1~~TRINITY_DN664_c0_g1_i1.p1  ORF type:complete len:360 (-),score=70.90 TRINITY_DN664_c0_g1_i1:76-1155(-)